MFEKQMILVDFEKEILLDFSKLETETKTQTEKHHTASFTDLTSDFN